MHERFCLVVRRFESSDLLMNPNFGFENNAVFLLKLSLLHLSSTAISCDGVGPKLFVIQDTKVVLISQDCTFFNAFLKETNQPQFQVMKFHFNFLVQLNHFHPTPNHIFPSFEFIVARTKE